MTDRKDKPWFDTLLTQTDHVIAWEAHSANCHVLLRYLHIFVHTSLH